MTVVAYAQPVAAKLFPAILTHPDGTITDGLLVVLTARTAEAPARLVAYYEDGPGGVVRAHTLLVATIVAARPDPAVSYGWVLTDDQDGTWTVRHGKGCGCTSPLNTLSQRNEPIPLQI